MLPVTLINEVALERVKVFAKRLVVVTAFEEVIVPAAKLKIFEVPETFAVVEYINGIVRVSNRKFVFVALEVNPAANILFVVMAFET